ncbi:unnamed protein product [Closterium sp. NIES-53]
MSGASGSPSGASSVDTRWGKAAAKHWNSSCLSSRTSEERILEETATGHAEEQRKDATSSGAGPREGGRPRTCSRSGTKYGLGRAGSPVPTGTAPGPPVAAPVPAAPPASTAPTPAGPAAPVPPVPPAGPTSAPTPPVAPARAAPEAPAAPTPAAAAAPPAPTAPVPLVRAPPRPGTTGEPPAPAARL